MRANVGAVLPIAAVMLAVTGTIVAPAVAAQSLGRLFTTVEERARLDQIRNDPDFGKAPEPDPEPEVVVEQTPRGPVVPAVTINGVVLRSSGNHFSWINGSRIAAGESTAEGIQVETRDSAGGRVRIRMPDGAETIQIKPGQKIDILSGKLLEAYEIRSKDESVSAFERLGDVPAAGAGAGGPAVPESPPRGSQRVPLTPAPAGAPASAPNRGSKGAS